MINFTVSCHQFWKKKKSKLESIDLIHKSIRFSDFSSLNYSSFLSLSIDLPLVFHRDKEERCGIKKSSNEPSRFISDSANRFPRFFEKIDGRGAARLLIGIWSVAAVPSIHPSIYGYRMGEEKRGAIMARDRSKNTPSSRARFVLESFSLGFFVSPPIVANYCAQYRRGCFCFCFFARKVRKNCSPVPLFEMIRVEFFDVSTFLL